MNQQIKFFLLVVLAVTNISLGVTPCQSKNDARTASFKSLNSCLNVWVKDTDPSKTSSSDVCTSKLNDFIQKSKDLKACFQSAKSH